ncbi:hypothetical protein C2E23DRAFT_881312 [Lenzites betulinus]|nr:hypothetical protein C2E23DRAFT_881312 [Lenzites betulinus]
MNKWSVFAWVGNPLQILINPAAPPLPSFVTPIMVALLTANTAWTNKVSGTMKKATSNHALLILCGVAVLMVGLQELEYNTTHQFATQCKLSNTVEDIIQAFWALGDEECAAYTGINKNGTQSKGKGTGRGMGMGRGRGKGRLCSDRVG